jgi:hypothetical protein
VRGGSLPGRYGDNEYDPVDIVMQRHCNTHLQIVPQHIICATLHARTSPQMVAGRFVNVYSKDDWILGVTFRAR